MTNTKPDTAGVSGAYSYADYGQEPDPSHLPLYLDHVIEFLRPLPQGAAVLDAGCGGGEFTEALASAGFTAFGSDMSASAIAHAIERGLGEYAEASLYEDLAAPFGREQFDAIICVEVIEHLYSPQSFVEQAARALPEGGLLVITTPYWGYWKNLLLAVTNRTDRALTALWEGGHIKHFSRATLGELMGSNGFEEVAFRGTGEGWRAKIPYIWSGMAVCYRKMRSNKA